MRHRALLRIFSPASYYKCNGGALLRAICARYDFVQLRSSHWVCSESVTTSVDTVIVDHERLFKEMWSFYFFILADLDSALFISS